MKSKKKLVEEYIQRIVGKLCYDHGVSLREAHKLVEELDLLNAYKGDYNFLLHKDISIWVNLIVNRHQREMKKENLKNKTIVKTQSNNILVYNKQPTTENTKYGDVVLYENGVWMNKGDVFELIPFRDLDGYIDKDGTIFKKPLTKDYVDEKVKEVSKENTMENYIVINGKKAELTEEQLKQLGIEVKKESEEKMDNPFNSELKNGDICFVINTDEGVKTSFYDSITDKHRLNNANSFNDKDFADQVYLHELLNRKLLKFAYDNNAEDCKWNGENLHYFIFLDTLSNKFKVEDYFNVKTLSTIHFSNKKIAKQAIQDVIEPFMKEHPEFVW